MNSVRFIVAIAFVFAALTIWAAIISGDWRSPYRSVRWLCRTCCVSSVLVAASGLLYL